MQELPDVVIMLVWGLKTVLSVVAGFFQACEDQSE